ncbi:hypothetical protein SCHPADRAFT_862536 [Schizopora paradoxa]|uniref:Fibronectin type III/BRCA1 domain-containing protein n=1 Tax=Schizopora paradoxa TaxID=27342 RepID=A0A0H2RKB3_9AGAM|nr:hypothetical protein SCHPADRAFT_862536 [Schizopora paradoxa]
MAGSSKDSFTFTVGKLDAGMAILLGERAHLIEFPSILLPAGATTGSIVNIAVHRNIAEEKRRDSDFWALQKEIYDTFGVESPKAPKLELRNVTQTSVTLEWPQVQLATAKLRSLDIYRNGVRLAAIPQPTTNTSTKLSGLELNTDYTFQLILRTTAGTYPSNLIRVRTHTMTDTSGISVCFGTVQDEEMLEEAKAALQEMRAKWSDKIQIDTTHFVCTSSAAPGSPNAGPGVEYQRALQLSLPIVQPQWILACAQNKKMMPISQFYLGTTPSTTISSNRTQSMSQVSLQRTVAKGATSPTGAGNRASMPPAPRRPAANGEADAADTSAFVNQTPSPKSPSAKAAATRVRSPDRRVPAPLSVPEEGEDVAGAEGDSKTSAAAIAARRQRNGTMDRNFRFPSPASQDAPPVPPVPALPTSPTSPGAEVQTSPTSVALEVPPPDPIEKEKKRMNSVDVEEDIGATEEISLN